MKYIKFKKELTIIFLILFVTFTAGCFQNSENRGEYIESFEFSLLNGNIKNMSDFRGSVVLLDLFGVNCQPCQYQMLVLDEVSTKYENKGLKMVSIDVWIVFGETTSLVNEFIDAFKQNVNIDLDWTIGVDDTDGTLFNRYVPEGQGIPMLYILDENGNIYYSHSGYVEYSTLSVKLDELLN